MQTILNAFSSDKKVLTLKELRLGYACSEVTLRRKIKQAGLLVSYNFNARFYTLPSTPSFNEDGIWKHKGILFSTQGTLTKMMIMLTGKSKAGYTAEELKLILHVRVNDLLRIQVEKERLARKKMEQGYVYYSSDERVFAMQLKEREVLINAPLLKKVVAEILKDKDTVIAILVAIVLSGDLNEERLQRGLKDKKVKVDSDGIGAVISHFGLKKMTRRSRH